MMPEQPRRILHVSAIYAPAYVYGGPARSVPLLCEGLAVAGAAVTVLTTNANGRGVLDVPSSRPVTRHGVQVTYFPRRGPGGLFYTPALAAAVRRLAPAHDVVHITGLWTYPCAAAARASRQAGTPYVISPRGMLMPWEFGHKAWKKRLFFALSEYPRLQASAGLHCTTPAERDALARFGLAGRAFVVPNGLDLAEFAALPARGSLRTRLGIPADALLLLFLGRLHPKKGLELTLEAFAALAATHPAAHLVLAGPDEGGYAARVPAWAAGHGMGGRVHLTGELQGAGRLSAYADADLFVLLSHSENFGQGVAEALACGLPVVLTAEVGIAPWVAAAGAGVVVSHDAAAVAAAVAALIEQPGALAALGAAGRHLAATEFGRDAVGRRMLAVYEQLITHYEVTEDRTFVYSGH